MNQVTVYEPFADLFPELFRGLAQTRPRRADAAAAAGAIPMNLTESDSEYVVEAQLPGIAKEQIAVEIDGNRVSISTDSVTAPQTIDGIRVLRQELSRGALSRRFEVASDIDEDAAGATYENGILTLTLPKKAVVSRRLEIA